MASHGTTGLAAGPYRGRVAALLAVACLAAGCAAEPASQDPPLRIGVHGDPSSFDPHLQSEVIAQWVLGNVYDTLVAFDVNMGLEPWLAERWENPSDRVVRFHLRDGVTFHDGRLLTAEDVAFSLERARHHPASRSAGALVGIEEVRLLDARTIELHTAAPYPILLNKLTGTVNSYLDGIYMGYKWQCVEFARRSIPGEVRPEFPEMEAHVKDKQ